MRHILGVKDKTSIAFSYLKSEKSLLCMGKQQVGILACVPLLSLQIYQIHLSGR